MKIGVLALQGGFAEHMMALQRLNVDGFLLRKRSDLERSFDGLIIPGGESTTMGKLLKESDLLSPIKALINDGLAVFGTCAGMILLASAIEHETAIHFGCLPITVKRNAFGRQLGSFYTVGTFQSITDVPMTFIRAPVITKADPSVTILAKVEGLIVAAEMSHILVTSFHPELTDDLTVHEYFITHTVQNCS